MALPLDVEAVRIHPVQASERAVELLIQIFRVARMIALNEAIADPVPFAVNINGVVERGRTDDRQKSRLQTFIDEPLTGVGDECFSVGDSPLDRSAASLMAR